LPGLDAEISIEQFDTTGKRITFVLGTKSLDAERPIRGPNHPLYAGRVAIAADRVAQPVVDRLWI
jgi:hypothetical protein